MLVNVMLYLVVVGVGCGDVIVVSVGIARIIVCADVDNGKATDIYVYGVGVVVGGIASYILLCMLLVGVLVSLVTCCYCCHHYCYS